MRIPLSPRTAACCAFFCILSVQLASLHADTPASDSDTKLVLTTKHYVVTIIDDRPEGELTSDTITYIGVSRRIGKTIRLTGSTWHTTAADGTPGRFLGYRFKHGDITYEVLDEGELIVVRGDSDVLVDETGTWKD